MEKVSTATPLHCEPSLQHRLVTLNRQRFTPAIPTALHADGDSLTREFELRRDEIAYIERERQEVQGIADAVPRQADDFVAWFGQLLHTGPGQNDPLFPWLADHASLETMRWFLTQEMAGEAGFDDLVALTQLRLPPEVKLEMARNFWDEMGQGHRSAMHGPLFHALAEALNLPSTSTMLPEALAVGNLCSALAANRPYCFLSLGALGAIELTAPGRCAYINAGLRRLGVSGSARRYYAVHATLDVKHAEDWLACAIHPMVTARPDVAPLIAAGALLRLRAGARCFVRYREILWERQQ